ACRATMRSMAVEAEVLTAGAAAGVTHRALEVAGGGNLHQPDAGVLLVLRAQAAVVRAALERVGGERLRQLARDAVLHAVVLAGVAADEVLAHAVRRALLAEVDAAVARDDLG